MKNIKKYALVAAIVIPSAFSFGTNSEAAKAKMNENLAQAVNVRSEATISDNVLGLIDDKTEYEIKETLDTENGEWFKIEFDGEDAYVASYLFDIVGEVDVLSPSNFRKEDSIESEIITLLEEEDKVEVLEYANNGYVKVNYNGQEGYVFAQNLDLPNKEIVYKNTYYYEQANYSSQASNYYYSQPTYYSEPETYYSDSSYVANSSSAKEIIAQRESGGSYDARNGQYIGRYQLSASYLNGDYSPENQERVADNYVSQRYGSWENALEFWNNNGWY